MGVEKVITRHGDGATFPKRGDLLTMHYKGSLTKDGTVFDSSAERGPFQFTIGVGQVIKGWDEGVAKMSLGEKAVLHISPDFGYGARGESAQRCTPTHAAWHTLWHSPRHSLARPSPWLGPLSGSVRLTRPAVARRGCRSWRRDPTERQPRV